MWWRVLVQVVTRFHKRRNLLTSQAVIRLPRKTRLHAISEFSTLGAFASSRSSVRQSACRYQLENEASWFFHIGKIYQTHNQQAKNCRANFRSRRTTLKTLHENLPDFLDFPHAWAELWYSCSAHMQLLSRSGPTGNLGKRIHTFYQLNSVCQEVHSTDCSAVARTWREANATY